MRTIQDSINSSSKTTRCRYTMVIILLISSLAFVACGLKEKEKPNEEEEALSRTEFTEHIENFFEYSPLKRSKASQFLIHLTDLEDGSPVEKAEVTLIVRSQNGVEVNQTKARIGKVTGIYVADMMINNPGDYDIEFHIKNEKLDERLPLKNFKVE